eukprot:SAG22_NODE_11369_length_488_cov_0.946015_2_plen_76_part_00
MLLLLLLLLLHWWRHNMWRVRQLVLLFITGAVTHIRPAVLLIVTINECPGDQTRLAAEYQDLAAVVSALLTAPQS